MNKTILNSDREKIVNIPFFENILPYSNVFLSKVDLTSSTKQKLFFKLLEELSSDSEIVLQNELDSHIINGSNCFEFFTMKLNSLLSINYPVLHEKLQKKENNFTKQINNIVNRFNKDRSVIVSTFGLNSKPYNLKIIDINTELGDSHKGEKTAEVILSDGTKLIYKPRNVSISSSYNSFIKWINHKLSLDLNTFRVVDKEEYGWLEFVHNDDVSSADDLNEYYFKAGVILAVTLILGSKDCHRENIIASGKNPIILDHETIIQPFLDNPLICSWDEKHGIPYFSVLESILIVNSNTGAPKDFAGFGVKGQLELTELDKKVINPNTIHSKRVTKFVSRKLVDKNLPIYEGKYVFANEFKESLLCGFSTAYDMFLCSINELKSSNSPINFFKNREVRYVWRPTFVYSKILKYMRDPSFMKSSEIFECKLYELLSKAYQSDSMKNFKFMLELELEQMLNYDIPIFNLDSQSSSLKNKEKTNIFKYNSIENINQRINLLSPKHKLKQIEYISNWLDMKY